MTFGIVLAGGASSRMGQPKALLALGSTTMAERLFALFESVCDSVVIVTGAHHQEIFKALPTLSSNIVFNENYQQGMFSSLQKGLVCAESADAVLFSPVDFAAVNSSSIACLFEDRNAQVIKPRWHGHSGHPVLIRAHAIRALLDAPATANAKQILAGFEAHYIDVEDRAVAEDCDTPEDYNRLLKRFQVST